MAAHPQYRPVSTLETTANAGLSVRLFRDMQDSVNNAKIHVLRHPIRKQICFPAWKSFDNTVAEHVIAMFLPVGVPDGYVSALWVLGHARIAGTGTTTWRLYHQAGIYRGNRLTLTSAWIDVAYKKASIVTSTDDHDVTPNTDLTLYQVAGRDATLILTAQNSDAGTRSEITTIDITPM